MRLEQDWLTRDSTQKVCAALTAKGALALFVGGCVRNALMGEPVSDLDIATDARPEMVLSLSAEAGIKAIPTGLEHGTITLVEDGIPFEVTTFRKDVATDGRRAVVAFSNAIEDDAARRDFTINALYARPDGFIVDPLNGLPDLRARRLRFIGQAEHRIREDYLRILRYFRFHALYCDPENGFDSDTLAAIADNLEGVSQLSKERVGTEMVKLFSAADPAPAIAVMRQIGVLDTVMEGADDRALAPLIHLEGQVDQWISQPNPSLRLAAVTDKDLQTQLRLSKAMSQQSAEFRALAISTMGAHELAYRYGASQAAAAIILRAALLEMPIPANLEPDLILGARAEFPVSAQDLMPDYSGAALGSRLRKLEQHWIKSSFLMTANELLALP